MIFWQDIRGWVLAGCSQRISLAFIRRISLVTIGRNSLVMARHQTLATMPSSNEKPAEPPEVLRAPEPASAIPARALTRVHRERLRGADFLGEVVKGWYTDDDAVCGRCLR